MRHSRRWAASVLAAAGALVLGVLPPAFGVSSGHALKRVEPGTAAATASVLGLSPAVSGLSLTTTIGESSAAYQHAETQAKSATFDMGSLGLVLATSTFCGKSLLPTSSQPHPLKVDSESGPTHRTSGGGGVGGQDVSMVRAPQSANATTTTIKQSLPGILSVEGYSHAEVRYLEGQAQVARSEVVENVSLLGGKVRLEGMRWTATRRSGATETRATHFSLGRVTLAGTPLGAPDSGSQIAAINKVLGVSGLSVRQPSRTTNSQTGAATIGPFTLRFSGSTVERTLLAPVAKTVVQLEDAIRAAGSAGDNCAHIRELIQNLGNNADTLLNVAIGISQGAGALDVNLGGVAVATLNQASYDNPFGSGGLGVPPVISHPSGDAATVPTQRVISPAGSATVGVPSATAPRIANAALRCESTSPSHAHGCWRGVATVASLGALGVGLALLVADIVVTRRRRLELRSADAGE